MTYEVRVRAEEMGENRCRRTEVRLEQEPNCNASDHWGNEIKVWEAEVARLRLRLPNGC